MDLFKKSGKEFSKSFSSHFYPRKFAEGVFDFTVALDIPFQLESSKM